MIQRVFCGRRHANDAWSNRIAALFDVSVPKANLTGARDKAQTVYGGAPTEARAKLPFFRIGHISLELIEPDANLSTWREGLEKKGDSLRFPGG
jgi:methylmalonyl-CoA/ethylmalonyl-CoA epimerase